MTAGQRASDHLPDGGGAGSIGGWFLNRTPLFPDEAPFSTTAADLRV